MEPFDSFRSISARNSSATGVSGQASTFVERHRQPRVNARGGTCVLSIDDSPTIALRNLLGSVGFIPLHAPDAGKGLELALKELPDLVLLDIVLPGMNGLALPALRRDAQTRQIPAIMMSGSEQVERFFGIRISADGFMKKPFSRMEVLSRIEQLLDEDLVPRRRMVRSTPNRGDATGTRLSL